MKFSSSLKFNAVPEWWDDYIAYDALKKHVYQLEKQLHGLSDSYRDLDLESNERTSLIPASGYRTHDPTSTDAVFIPLLDRERHKISTFYGEQEKQMLGELTELQALVEAEDELGPSSRRYADDAEDEDDEEDEEDHDDDEDDDAASPTTPAVRDPTRSPDGRRRRRSISFADRDRPNVLEDSLASLPPMAAAQERASRSVSTRGTSFSPSARTSRRSLARRLRDSIASLGSHEHPGDDGTTWTSNTNYAWDTRLLFRRRITNLYTSTSNLKSYVEINQSGFRKILKKYDKVTESDLKSRYLDELSNTAPFDSESRARLADALSQLHALYAKCVKAGDTEAAARELRLHRREHVAWERETVWRTMIGQTARAETHADDSDGMPIGRPHVETEEKPSALVQVGRFRLTRKMVALLVAVAVGVVLLNVRVVESVEANRCLAILIFSAIMWATEAIPLFVTSMLVPFLLITLRVVRDPDTGQRLSTPDATKWTFSVMFSPTIMLLIGGFTIASALSKTAIDRLLITRVLGLAGTRPNTVLLAVMGVACFASMWISNVAAPTLCFTLIRPILRTLPSKASFAPCLILGIALAANIGGQSSPISSPQNLIALQAMDPPLDWGSWFAVALPVSAVSIILIWLLLIVSYKPASHPDGTSDLEIRPLRAPRERFTAQQWWVTFVCVVTIALWCVEHSIERWVGDMGVIALIPVVAFFATGVLKKDDFEQFAWTIVFLAMGGIALGKGVTVSGLLETLDVGIRKILDGLSLYTVVLVLSAVVLVVSTFISHTIASVLLVPIAREVGRNLPGDHANLLIFLTGLVCSTGMGMPVSGFPNQTAANQEDELGQLYLSNIDFLKNGVPASIIATLVVATIGFLLMKLIGL